MLLMPQSNTTSNVYEIKSVIALGNKGNNKVTELRTILQREIQNQSTTGKL
jgi:hypothetical protein